MSTFKKIAADIRKYLDPDKVLEGALVEREHPDLVQGNLARAALIAKDHLKERDDYYPLLREKVENAPEPSK